MSVKSAMAGLAGVMTGGLMLTAVSAAANASFIPVGPQNDVLVSTVTNTWGWTTCWSGNYGDPGPNIAGLLSGACQGGNLMMAGKRIGSNTFDVLAAASTADVTFDTGTGNITHTANGSEWYFNGNWSWGFAGLGDAVNRNSCDIGDNERDRLCWHTSGGAISTGFRSGNNIFLQNSRDWERFLLVKSVPEPGTLALFGLGLAGLGFARRRKAA